MSPRRSVATFFMAAMSALFMTAQSQAQAPDLGKFVVVDAGSGIQYFLPTLAKDLGYFEEEGLDVEILVAGSGTDATAALISGEADIIQTGLPHFIASNQQGLQLWAIAPAIEAYTMSVVVANEVLESAGVTPDSSLDEKMKGLAAANAKLGISRVGAGTDLFIQYVCLQTGVDCASDLQLMPLGAIGPTLAAFDQRQIVGYVRSHPDVDLGAARSNGTVLIAGSRGDVPSLKGSLYLMLGTSQRQIDERPEHLAAFLRGIGKAMKFVAAHPDEAREIGFRTVGKGIDKEIFDAAWKQTLPSFAQDPVIERSGVDTTFSVLAEIEGQAPEIDPEKVYRTDIADAAWKAVADFAPVVP